MLTCGGVSLFCLFGVAGRCFSSRPFKFVDYRNDENIAKLNTPERNKIIFNITYKTQYDVLK